MWHSEQVRAIAALTSLIKSPQPNVQTFLLITVRPSKVYRVWLQTDANTTHTTQPSANCNAPVSQKVHCIVNPSNPFGLRGKNCGNSRFFCSKTTRVSPAPTTTSVVPKQPFHKRYVRRLHSKSRGVEPLRGYKGKHSSIPSAKCVTPDRECLQTDWVSVQWCKCAQSPVESAMTFKKGKKSNDSAVAFPRTTNTRWALRFLTEEPLKRLCRYRKSTAKFTKKYVISGSALIWICQQARWNPIPCTLASLSQVIRHMKHTRRIFQCFLYCLGDAIPSVVVLLSLFCQPLRNFTERGWWDPLMKGSRA